LDVNVQPLKTESTRANRHTPETASHRSSILIIDDNLDDLALMAEVLQNSNFDIRQARSTAQGLRSATKYPPDLIILDIDMPDVNGLDACRLVKARADLAPVPVIFISAHFDKSKKLQAFSMGAVDYITKPFDPDEVFKRVELQVLNFSRIRDLEKDLRTLEDKAHGENVRTWSHPDMTVSLTNRESECLVWLARGLRNEVIADRLAISPATVEMHLSNARRKLAAATREQAIAIAIQFGLISP
jgi:DNA-binding NarL/FixJ family response regulator